MSMFQKATRRKAFLKLALSGPSGSGKTMSALRLARGLTDGRIALGDTENRSASLYAGYALIDSRSQQPYKAEFDVCDIPPPYISERFLDLINGAKADGFEVLILDSFSHVWEAVLQFKANMDEAGGNSYTNWNAAGKKFQSVLDLIRKIDMHVICCMRSKTDYVLETNDKGKQAPRKVGLAPIVRDGTEYEFSTMFELDMQNMARDTKGRLKHITGGEPILLNESVGQSLRDWINEGEPALPQPETWTEANKALANAAVNEYMTLLGATTLPSDVTELKASGKTPTEIITAIKNLVTKTKEAK